MIKKILVLIVLIMVLLTGCGNPVFLEPEEYTIVKIGIDFGTSFIYGYIKDDDLMKIENNEIDYVNIYYPYDDSHKNQNVTVKVSKITFIEKNIYKDYR